MRHRLLLSLCALLAAPTFAAELEVGLEIPRLEVAEYHRPYVAVWLQRPDKTHVADLAVWYGLNMKNNKGEKWLDSLRQWWQISGRHLDMPVDGVSGATRPVGEHRLTFSDDRAPLKDLPAGEYHLMVEVARQGGKRELLGAAFTWPPAQAEQFKAQGKSELGAMTIRLTP
ncbi:DUF2271 domain-containing protein [Azotobacter beijerinckii]|uniref:DUF2271 domain-containing protein n=1 Tax=Azotobacter beijerinckii TaxID=170623 RepID=UPI0029553AFD|nr:DUF2271 domain-containing protein [Azotobacter beijerinckii]MDV7211599.1 DUF2271 domain-containing protein [Azotobacter beijerinckii]